MRHCLYPQYDEYYNSDDYSEFNKADIIRSIIDDYENKLKDKFNYEDSVKLLYLKEFYRELCDIPRMKRIREAIEDLQYRIRRLDDDCDDIRDMTRE
jgi:hypothetical protein